MMTDRELRRLHREDLLQILIAQQKQIQDLSAALEDTEKALSDRKIAIEESGSLAEAALKLNDVFSSAQQAADLYISETRERIDALRAEADAAVSKARAEAAEILRQARKEAADMLDDARREADRLRYEVNGEKHPDMATNADAEDKNSRSRRK
ncbi:MAG: hypothetical protein ACSW8J_10450 [bacterium]